MTPEKAQWKWHLSAHTRTQRSASVRNEPVCPPNSIFSVLEHSSGAHNILTAFGILRPRVPWQVPAVQGRPPLGQKQARPQHQRPQAQFLANYPRSRSS